MNITVLQIHKRDSHQYKFIQDKYGLNVTNGTFSIADGTTQSFRSEIWAKFLSEYFVDNPTFSIEELIEKFSRLSEKFENLVFEFSSNPAKASLERTKRGKGGTSTFLAIQFLSQNKIRVVSCGDSNLFILSEDKTLISSYPFSSLESLDTNNYFLNTKTLTKKEVDKDFFQYTEIELKEKESIILATDALSRLILKDKSVVKEICELSNFDELHQFCLNHWEAKELEEDDITAMILSPFKMKEIREILPPINFEFPIIETPEFIPLSLQQSHQTITPMQMNEIKNQFNGVAQDFYSVKRSLRINRLLMGLIIFLLSLNLVFLFINTRKVKSHKANSLIENSQGPVKQNISTPKKKKETKAVNSSTSKK